MRREKRPNCTTSHLSAAGAWAVAGAGAGAVQARRAQVSPQPALGGAARKLQAVLSLRCLLGH